MDNNTTPKQSVTYASALLPKEYMLQGRSNWDHFQRFFPLFLSEHGYWNSTTNSPTSSRKPLTITKNVCTDLYPKIRHCEIVAEIWTTLQKKFNGSDVNAKMRALKDLMDLRPTLNIETSLQTLDRVKRQFELSEIIDKCLKETHLLNVIQ
ncbi:hypothetical protein ROZALSC1DRAFT_23685 [Rozella allomycis CSF55]|uniref:Uncharacterized protein n=1 Tax=Rozella allomycis (strain CSF55) TaxID=988480 RepID=A0A4P9YFM9_ROZAC|nr:hypothetical protein ROZALSC1DRAFT_23685 [Rozella allomycis CSF55]